MSASSLLIVVLGMMLCVAGLWLIEQGISAERSGEIVDRRDNLIVRKQSPKAFYAAVVIRLCIGTVISAAGVLVVLKQTF